MSLRFGCKLAGFTSWNWVKKQKQKHQAKRLNELLQSVQCRLDVAYVARAIDDPLRVTPLQAYKTRLSSSNVNGFVNFRPFQKVVPEVI